MKNKQYTNTPSKWWSGYYISVADFKDLVNSMPKTAEHVSCFAGVGELDNTESGPADGWVSEDFDPPFRAYVVAWGGWRSRAKTARDKMTILTLRYTINSPDPASVFSKEISDKDLASVFLLLPQRIQNEPRLPISTETLADQQWLQALGDLVSKFGGHLDKEKFKFGWESDVTLFDLILGLLSRAAHPYLDSNLKLSVLVVIPQSQN
ncbi:uncharacterized protein B0H18DRAFT_2504 [Fomitopsis serialis]|uniref:uncharacterized protein n=1 Tax=Fomitopsis serialis TaxID=139415 RepID=UPI002008DB85|nr:uncharacterized protein B0H18DRAFT_2504 [Neoantrodia serialis]KAH9938076.1 hypothetical protein B0H18DRAFT_2504 [Neoantrodia serialis]